MSRSLITAMLITDFLFVIYWAASILAAAGLIAVPSDQMYADYRDVRVAAWNWSFLPLDMALSILGLCAVAADRRGSALWRPLAIMALTLTATAGGTAVTYWTILREFDPAWFLPNLVLFVWPFACLPKLCSTRSSCIKEKASCD